MTGNNKTCVLVSTGRYSPLKTACGNDLVVTIESLSYEFCPYCGNKIHYPDCENKLICDGDK